MPKSLKTVMSIAILSLLLSAPYSIWLCDVDIKTIRYVGEGSVMLSPGALLFLVLLAMTVLKLICAIALCAWAVRVTHNLRVFGLVSPEDNPRILMESWFVPILNWVTLYRGLSRLWRASVIAAQGAHAGSMADRRSVPLFLWLAAWITHGAGVLASVVLYFQANQYIWFICWLIRDVALLLAVPLAVAVIFQISRMQARALATWTRDPTTGHEHSQT